MVTSRERIVLGEVIGAHGTRGELRIRIAGDSPENLMNAESVWLARRAKDPEARRRRVIDCGLARGGEVRMKLDGIDRRDAVEPFLGMLVTAKPDLLPPLPEGEFYWYQLVGCEVFSAENQSLGTVREIWETGAHDVLVVRDDDGVQRLIPTAAELLSEIDLSAERIVVVDLPGLLEPA